MIELVNGRGAARVDADDFERVAAFRWHRTVSGRHHRYAVTETKIDGKRVRLVMHRFILDLTDRRLEVDHINGDGLDNRKENLRLATHAENLRNRMKRHFSAESPYKGVGRRGHRWVAGVMLNGVRMILGVFDTAREAALAYDDAIRGHHGEFAAFNFPRDGERGALIPDDAAPELIFSTPQAAAYVGLSRQEMCDMRVMGGGPKFTSIGNDAVYRQTDLAAWKSERESP